MSRNTDNSQANNGAQDSAEVAALKKEVVDLQGANDALAKQNEALKEGVNEGGGKEERDEQNVDWQKTDYDGALTIEQAEWRNKNIKLK